MIAPILARRDAAGFWLAVVLTGAGTGLGAAALTGLLELVQHMLWYGSGIDILAAASRAPWWWHLAVLLAAGVLTAAGQLLLVRLSSANGIDITAAIWFHAGRLPAVRTLGSAVLSVLIVGMGASLGREGAPKQAGAVIANLLSDRTHLSDEMRRLLVACGAGAGMAAAYGVPLGGALFALEVLRGELALRFVLPALVTSLQPLRARSLWRTERARHAPRRLGAQRRPSTRPPRCEASVEGGYGATRPERTELKRPPAHQAKNTQPKGDLKNSPSSQGCIHS